MSYVIAVISQKGGVGKSSLAQLVAHGYAVNDYAVLLADMDSGQSSSVKWNSIRQDAGLTPAITVKGFRTTAEAEREGANFDLTVYDGAPHATAQTLDIARKADLILLPSNTSKYDLDPQISLAHELVKAGVGKKKIFFVLSRIVATENDLQAAFDYIGSTDYKAFPNYLEEKTGYRQAAEQGKAMTETPFKSLSSRSQALFGNISTTLLKQVTKDAKVTS